MSKKQNVTIAYGKVLSVVAEVFYLMTIAARNFCAIIDLPEANRVVGFWRKVSEPNPSFSSFVEGDGSRCLWG
jgi:hypothetical protein